MEKKNIKKHLFDSKEAKILWEKSDDAYRSSKMLTELYNGVPKEFKDVIVNVLEFQVINANQKLKKKVLKWLNKE